MLVGSGLSAGLLVFESLFWTHLWALSPFPPRSVAAVFDIPLCYISCRFLPASLPLPRCTGPLEGSYWILASCAGRTCHLYSCIGLFS